MKVLHCYRTFYPETQGGLEQAIFEMARHTSGSEVLTLSNTPGEVSVSGIPVQARRRWLSVASCCMGPGLLLDLYKKQTDVLHLHFPWPFGDLAYLLGGRRRPLIVTYHSDIVRQRALGAVYGPLMRWFLNRADRIVATSPDYLASSPILRDYQDKVEVIPLGISECSYPEPSDGFTESLRARFSEGFMLFVGALRYYKGLEFLVRAAPGLPFPILVAGKGPEERKLRSLAANLGAENVHFLGHVDDEEKMALLSLCRAVVFPSHLRSEAFGVTLLEGMMAGKPLVSCDIGTGTSYVNINSETGHVIQPADPSALRAAMLDLWLDPHKAASWGRAARARYESMFTGQKMAGAYGDLYRRVLAERTDNQAII